MQCPNCRRPNPEGTLACVYCGQLLPLNGIARQTNTQTCAVPVASGDYQPRWGTAYFDQQRRLLLHVIESDQIIETPIHQTGHLILGRLDPSDDQPAALNLTACGALAAGVSRQHAYIGLIDHSLLITDLDSTNATSLNGQRLDPYEPRIVRDGDEICLGLLKLRVIFTDEVDDQHPPLAEARPQSIYQ